MGNGMGLRRLSVWVAVFTLLQGAPAFSQPGLQEALIRGSALENSGKLEDAIDVYRQLVLRYPDRSDLLYRLQAALVKAGRKVEAIQLLKNRLDRFPSDRRSRLYMGDIYAAMGRPQEAAEIWEILIHKSKQMGNFAMVGSRFRTHGMPERARQTYLRGRRAVGEPGAFAMELAGLYEDQREYKEAVAEYLNLLNHNPRKYQSVASRFVALGKDDKALETVLHVLVDSVRSEPDDPLRARLLTDYSLSVSRPGEAVSLFVEMDRRDTAMETIFHKIATQCAEGGAHGVALLAYRTLIQRFPSSSSLAKARMGEARAEEALGQTDRAIELYKQIGRSYPGGVEAQESAFRTGEIRRVVNRDYERALGAYRMLLNIQFGGPWQRQAIMGIGACLLSQGDTEGAGQNYRAVARMIPGSEMAATAAFKLAELEYLSGRFEAAQKSLEDLIEGPATGFVVNDALALSNLIAKGLGVSGAYLIAYAEADLLRRRGFENAIRAFEAFVTEQPRGGLAECALMSIARLEAERGRYSKASGVYLRIIKEYGKSFLVPEARMEVAVLFEEHLGRLGDAAREYEVILSEYADSPLYEEARSRLRRLEERIRG